jgi:hypothetical protein
VDDSLRVASTSLVWQGGLGVYAVVRCNDHRRSDQLIKIERVKDKWVAFKITSVLGVIFKTKVAEAKHKSTLEKMYEVHVGS